MAVTGMMALALDVPDLDAGIAFYTQAGLEVSRNGNEARLRCKGGSHDCIILKSGTPSKRLNHVALFAEDLAGIAQRAQAGSGEVIAPPAGYPADGLWLRDPNGTVFHLVESVAIEPLPAVQEFQINSPGHVQRVRRSAILPGKSYPPAKPLKLGHILLFSPDVDISIAFVTEVLGMGLADRSQDIIAFCCARRNSDHHVLAFAKSPGIGFHHASFEVADPDEVGRGGRALLASAGRGDWGFGRHTIGSNFFHYVQDPWGSWFEYYSDMDHIDDLALWTPTDYELEDSLASWAPPVPGDFVHNYEAAEPFAFSE